MKQEAGKHYFLRSKVRIFLGVGQRSAVCSPPSFGVRHGASIHPAAESSFDIRHSSFGFRNSLSIRVIRESSCWDASDIDGQTERSNGAFEKSDIEGKAARVAARERDANEFQMRGST